MTPIPHAQMVDRIITALRSDGQFIVTLPGDDREKIERLRALGRQAGRRLGWKVRTFASDPDRRTDGASVVIVAVIDSSALHQQLMRVRGEKALRRAFESWDLGGSRGSTQ